MKQGSGARGQGWHQNHHVSDKFSDCHCIDSLDLIPSNRKHSGLVWPQVGDKKLLDPPVDHYHHYVVSSAVQL